MLAEIVVARAGEAWPDRYRSYRVLVDGDLKTKLARGSQATVSVTPGRHAVRMRIDWCGSATLDLDLSDGDRAYLTCQSGVRQAGFRLFGLKGVRLLLLYLSIRRNRYIDLRLQRIEHSG